jgi:membrane protease YdiL (CAAX protease family)
VKKLNLLRIGSMVKYSILLFLTFLSCILSADDLKEYNSIQDSQKEIAERRRSEPPRLPSSPNPATAALLGIIPGMGQAYIGNYTTAGVQFGMFIGIQSTRNHFSSQPDYINSKNREVTFSTESVLIGYGFQRSGLTYTDVPLPISDDFKWSETKFERDYRLIKEKRFAEQNTYIKYGEYTRTNRTTYYSDMLSNPVLSLSLYSIYSSYRDAGGLGEYKKSESIEDLAFAPFNPNVLKLPFVYAPLLAISLFLGLGQVVNDGSNPILLPESLKKDGSLYAGAFVSGISPAIGEEAFFRGYLNHRLSMSPLLGPYGGLGVSSTIFMLAHEGNSDARDGRLVRLLGGFYFGYIHMLYGYDLRPSIAAHFWYNFLIGLSEISRYKSDPNYDKSERDVFFMPLSYTLQIQ